MLVKARHRPLVSGKSELLGQLAIATEDFKGRGHVMIRGEIWQADCDDEVRQEQQVRVKAIEGLTLKVTREDK